MEDSDQPELMEKVLDHFNYLSDAAEHDVHDFRSK